MGTIGYREASLSDFSSICDLLARVMGADDRDEYFQFLRWKHLENTFGQSSIWIAEVDDEVVGVRSYMRWRLLYPDGSKVSAVRAVDTATDPRWQRRGIFRKLSLMGVEALEDEGVGIVFNTPNAKSGPGDLKMGWSNIKPLQMGMRLGKLSGLGRLVRARTGAQRWSIPTVAGESAREFFENSVHAKELLAISGGPGVRTDETIDYFKWRTAFPLLHYRIHFADKTDPTRGAVLFRLRRRGPATEVAVLRLWTRTPGTATTLIKSVLTVTGADYALGLQLGERDGLFPAPMSGPLLMGRELTSPIAPADSWKLSLSDVELF